MTAPAVPLAEPDARAAAAFKGYTLARTNPADGPVTYYATVGASFVPFAICPPWLRS